MANMKKNFLCCLICILVFGINNAHADPDKQIDIMKQVNSIMGELLDLAVSRRELVKKGVLKGPISQMDVRGDVEKILSPYNDLDVLKYVIYVSNSYSSGQAGNQIIDHVFYEAWGLSIYKIQQTGTIEALDMLKHILLVEKYDAGSSVHLKETIWKMEHELDIENE